MLNYMANMPGISAGCHNKMRTRDCKGVRVTLNISPVLAFANPSFAADRNTLSAAFLFGVVKMAKTEGFSTKVPAPAGKPTMGRDIPKDSGAGIGKPGSPIKTPNDPSVTAPNKPFGDGTGFINAKI